MNAIQAQQAPHDLAIFSALIRQLPDECEFAKLDVQRSPSEGGERLALSLSGDGVPPASAISEELFLAVRKLCVFLSNAGHDLRSAEYKVNLMADGNWETKGIYRYNDSPNNSTELVPEESE